MIKYGDFLQLLDLDEFSYASFEIAGYPHYRNCVIQKIHRPILKGATEIVVTLSNRPSEKIYFWKTFDESYKLFYLGRKLGTLTLKQLWDRVIIHEIKL